MAFTNLSWKNNGKKVKVQSLRAFGDKRYKSGKNDVKGDGTLFWDMIAGVVNEILKARSK